MESDDSTDEAVGTLQQELVVPNPHSEGYRVTFVDETSIKITLFVTPSSSTSVPDTPVTSIVCKKTDAQPNRTGVETPEDVTALINLNTATFNSASANLAVNSRVSHASRKGTDGVERLSLFEGF